MAKRLLLLEAELWPRMALSVLALVHLHGLFIDLHWRRSRTEEKFLSNVIFGRNRSHNVCSLLLGSVATVI